MPNEGKDDEKCDCQSQKKKSVVRREQTYLPITKSRLRMKRSERSESEGWKVFGLVPTKKVRKA